jgi:IrrE N-terminal-like domain
MGEVNAPTDADSPLLIAGRLLHEAPVNLTGMAEALGLTVNMDARLSPDLSGRIIRGGNGRAGYHIDVNASHSFPRKRFTLAHEIAHYLLHRNLIGDGIDDTALYCSRLSDTVEVEANRQAACMLMPAPLVRRVYHAGLRWLHGLSSAFQVSEEAMRIRLQQFGLGV